MKNGVELEKVTVEFPNIGPTVLCPLLGGYLYLEI